MTFLIIIISLLATSLAYGGIGTTFARKHYAKIMTVQSQQGNRFAIIRQKRAEVNLIRHEAHCYLQYDILKKEGCTCSQNKKWWTIKNEIDTLKSDAVYEPTTGSLVKIVALWPVAVYASYLKGAPYTDYAAIERMENEIKEIA